MSALFLVPSDPPHEAISPELLALVERRAKDEGTTNSPLAGLLFHRASRPAVLRKWQSLGPSVTFVVQGKKVSTYRRTRITYDPSHYFVITGEAEFDGKVIEASARRPFLAICYQLPPDVVAKTLLSLADASVAPEPEDVPAYSAPLDAPIMECVTRLLRAIDEPLERRVVAPLVVEELVFRLLRSDAAAAVRSAVDRDQDTEKMAVAMRFLRENIERPITVADAARHVAMSASHFAHRFRAVARVSPMRYLKSLRLNQARSLLVANGLRISEVAARSGYESASHFTRDFKSFFGASPTEYAKKLREAESRSQDLHDSPQNPTS